MREISTTCSRETEQNEHYKKRMKSKSYKNIKEGITFSSFDLFHAGHVKMIEETKRQCNYSRVHSFSSSGLRTQVKEAELRKIK